MKRIGLTVIAAAILALPLCAQAVTLRGDVPFEFAIGSTTVQPGKYAFKFETGPGVRLVGNDCNYIFLANSDSDSSGTQEPKLVFLRYGNQYFLSRITTGATIRNFPMSRVELELKKTAAATGQVLKQIVLAARSAD